MYLYIQDKNNNVTTICSILLVHWDINSCMANSCHITHLGHFINLYQVHGDVNAEISFMFDNSAFV